jgi:hypothetical protein
MNDYTPSTRSAISLAFLATLSAVNGDISSPAPALALERASEALSCLVSMQMHHDFAGRCLLAHRASADAWRASLSAQAEQAELLRWRVAAQSWALAVSLLSV